MPFPSYLLYYITLLYTRRHHDHHRYHGGLARKWCDTCWKRMAWLDRDLAIVDRPLCIDNIFLSKVHLLHARVFVCPRAVFASQIQVPRTHEEETLSTALPSRFGRAAGAPGSSLRLFGGQTREMVCRETLSRVTDHGSRVWETGRLFWLQRPAVRVDRFLGVGLRG